MALTELIFGGKSKATVGATPPLRFGVLEFDASISETHSDELEVSDHPVEEGSDITDHVRLLPNMFEMTGIVTNTPLVYLASLTAKSPIQGSLLPASNRVDEAYAFLRQLQIDGVLCDVATSLRDYSDMVIVSLVVRREVSTGQALDVTIGFREVRKAKALSIDLPIPQKVENKKGSNLGNKSKKAATAKQAQKSTSALKKLLGAFG